MTTRTKSGRGRRQKGIEGELEVRDLHRLAGYQAERGQQRAGGGDSPDVKTNAPHFVEVKRTETFNIYQAWEQAEKDNDTDLPSVVFHRRNNKPWLVVIGGERYLSLLRGQEDE